MDLLQALLVAGVSATVSAVITGLITGNWVTSQIRIDLAILKTLITSNVERRLASLEQSVFRTNKNEN